MHAFDVLGDPVRRRILELPAGGELTSGAVCAVIQKEFGLTQPASASISRCCETRASQPCGPRARRLYAVNADPLHEVDAWLDRFGAIWASHLDALDTEVARGKRDRRRPGAGEGRNP
jgi:hypothetical protein